MLRPLAKRRANFWGRKAVPLTDTNNIGGPEFNPGKRDDFEGRTFTRRAQDFQKKPSPKMRPSQAKPADEAIASGGEVLQPAMGPISKRIYIDI